MNNLKTLRLRASKTQSDVAAILNVSRQMYSKYENGISQMPDEALKKLSSIFNVSIDYILNNQNLKTDNKKDVSSDAEYHPTLTERDEKDIQKRLTAILEDIDNQDTVAMYNGGEKMDDATRELMKASLENTIRIAKIKAKEKFTPKKYRK
jgi:transcriptional regulator with XRE-family HTH domain